MHTTIISIGNFRGIRIPKLLLEESGLGNEVELDVKKGVIRIIPAKINLTGIVPVTRDELNEAINATI